MTQNVGGVYAHSFRTRLPGVALLAGAGCEDTPEPTFGEIRVAAITSGGDHDLDGYAVAVDGAPRGTIDVNGTLRFFQLATGEHEVALSGVADNCTVTSENPRQVTVTGAEAALATFMVNCVATGIAITTTTTGLDVDQDGYAITVDGMPGPDTVTAGWHVAANGSFEITRLSAGSYQVTLGGVASNCVVGGENPSVASVTVGEVVPVAFDASCVAVTANIEVTAATSGADLDPNGYVLLVDDEPAGTLAANETATIEQLGPGDHTVRLIGVATNCTVSGDNPRTLSVTTGGTTRHTAQTRFRAELRFRPDEGRFCQRRLDRGGARRQHEHRDDRVGLRPGVVTRSGADRVYQRLLRRVQRVLLRRLVLDERRR